MTPAPSSAPAHNACKTLNCKRRNTGSGYCTPCRKTHRAELRELYKDAPDTPRRQSTHQQAQCPTCHATVSPAQLDGEQHRLLLCRRCGAHFRITARADGYVITPVVQASVPTGAQTA